MEFLKAMRIITSNSEEEKVDLFLVLVDRNSNGLIDFEEVKEICELTFAD